MNIKPFPYQETAIVDTVTALKEYDRALIVMAPGLGKTIVASFVALRQLAKEGRVLVLCHENKILEQNLKQFSSVLGNEYTYGLFTGEQKDCHEVDFLFASFQTMRTWKNAFHDDEFGSLVVDEGHHSRAASYEATILYFKPKYKVALTGTPDRTDELDIREIFGNEVVDISLAEGIAKGWLADVEYRLITDTFNTQALKRMLKDIMEDGKRVSIKQLNETIFVKARDEEVAAHIISRQANQTIVFCESILHAENFVKFLPGAETYHSGKGTLINNKNLESFKKGIISYLLVVNKLNEGVDIPSADMVVFLRSTDLKLIFFQQLGRGLRRVPGKEKVIVLDFVGNIDRISMVSDLALEINSHTEDELERNPIYLKGDAFEFYFTDLQVDLLKALERLSVDLYPTVEEASKAAIVLGIKDYTNYQIRYRDDPRLPSCPHEKYKLEWIDWYSFLGRERPEGFYPTVEEASKATRYLKINTTKEYHSRYKDNERLPSNPQKTYRLGWISWNDFLGKQPKDFYPNLVEASKAVQYLDIKTHDEYKKRYKEDKRLPSCPDKVYKSEWKDWYYFFLGKEKSFYPTLAEASKVATEMEIKDNIDYKKRYKEDERLPSNPNETYKSEWKGYPSFLGKEPKKLYSTIAEASVSAISLRIKSSNEYFKMHGEDEMLPYEPFNVYKTEWKGWKKFLGKSPKDFYPTLKKASIEVIEKKIKTKEEYMKRYKEDERLYCNPHIAYRSEWVSWSHFLGK
ncbi:MAG: superfamily II DNA or RNA helicase [Candidatus Paceibacteria bacterium]|jgi:superfamily II DNA or RNA helicase